MNSNKQKLQYFLENIAILSIILAAITLLFFPKNTVIITTITRTIIIIMFLLILVFEILKRRDSWFKSKSTFSTLFSVSQTIIVSILLNMSYDRKIPVFIGILYPLLILTYITIKDYKFNFK